MHHLDIKIDTRKKHLFLWAVERLDHPTLTDFNSIFTRRELFFSAFILELYKVIIVEYSSTDFNAKYIRIVQIKSNLFPCYETVFGS